MTNLFIAAHPPSSSSSCVPRVGCTPVVCSRQRQGLNPDPEPRRPGSSRAEEEGGKSWREITERWIWRMGGGQRPKNVLSVALKRGRGVFRSRAHLPLARPYSSPPRKKPQELKHLRGVFHRVVRLRRLHFGAHEDPRPHRAPLAWRRRPRPSCRPRGRWETRSLGDFKHAHQVVQGVPFVPSDLRPHTTSSRRGEARSQSVRETMRAGRETGARSADPSLSHYSPLALLRRPSCPASRPDPSRRRPP